MPPYGRSPCVAACWDGPNLARVRAIRVGIVVRSDEPDLKDPSLVGQPAAVACSTARRTTAHARAASRSTTPILVDGYRHRTYETIVPMINAIYNNGL